MNKLLVLSLVVLLSFTLSADWKALDGNSRGPANLDVKVLSSNAKQVVLEISIPGYNVQKMNVDGKECMMIHIPGSSKLMKAGHPLLPKLAKLVKVHNTANVSLEVLSKEEVTSEIGIPIVPSRGHLTRNIDVESVKREFGAVYQEDVFWPGTTEQVSVGQPFLLRNARGVRVRVLPVSVNHVKMEMKILKKVVVALNFSGVSSVNALNNQRGADQDGSTFQSFYKNAFVNYTATASRSGVPNADNKNLEVIVPAQFRSTIDGWVEWKQMCGYNVTIHEVQSGVTASEIKSYLQGRYDNASTRPGYVVLIGDASYSWDFETAEPMPSFKGSKEGAAADRVYVRLSGNDNYPDAFISRVSGNAEEIKTQLDKIVNYEKSPSKGKWSIKGVCIASNQGSPADYTRAEWLQTGGGKSEKVPVADGGLMGYGISHFDDVYDPSGNATQVANAVNDGRTVICYIGHGSSTSWVSSGFNNNDVANLNNGDKLPVIWSVACVNGNFLKTEKCFAEAWLRQPNGGAVAMEAASTNESWVPPCDKQAATVNAIINKTQQTFGALECVGCIAALENWGDGNSTEGNKLAEQCNLFGDCTLLVRTTEAKDMQVQLSKALDNGAVFQVTAAEQRAVANATVTVYSADFSYKVTAQTDAQGNATISLNGCPKCDLFYTVVGQDMVPVVNQPLK